MLGGSSGLSAWGNYAAAARKSVSHRVKHRLKGVRIEYTGAFSVCLRIHGFDLLVALN